MSLSATREAKIERIKRLAREGATEGERAAAREALGRLGVMTVDTAEFSPLDELGQEFERYVDQLLRDAIRAAREEVSEAKEIHNEGNDYRSYVYRRGAGNAERESRNTR